MLLLRALDLHLQDGQQVMDEMLRRSRTLQSVLRPGDQRAFAPPVDTTLHRSGPEYFKLPAALIDRVFPLLSLSISQRSLLLSDMKDLSAESGASLRQFGALNWGPFRCQSAPGAVPAMHLFGAVGCSVVSCAVASVLLFLESECQGTGAGADREAHPGSSAKAKRELAAHASRLPL
jgi:hypothetical protein